MESAPLSPITVETTVNAPIEKVWDSWTNPDHITKWCQASEDWHAPKAFTDLRVDGKFTTTMAAKDGSASFDWGGIYTNVEALKTIEYKMDDGRTCSVNFSGEGDETKIVETFDPEKMHTREQQQFGWQSILDNFKKYTEGL